MLLRHHLFRRQSLPYASLDHSLVSVVPLIGDQGASWQRPAKTSTPEYVEVRECSWRLSLS